jgi:uncharacterized membrane protein YkoI
MKTLSRQNLVATLFVTCVLCVSAAHAQDSEKKVKMSDLPEPVQKTVREQSKGATIRGFAKETENGKTSYEVEMKVNGHNKDVLIDPSGAVLAIEEQVALNALPRAVKAGLVRKAGKGKILSVESITKNDVLVEYEAQVSRAGKRSEIKVGADGKSIDSENEEDEAKEKAERAAKKKTGTTKKP